MSVISIVPDYNRFKQYATLQDIDVDESTPYSKYHHLKFSDCLSYDQKLQLVLKIAKIKISKTVVACNFNAHLESTSQYGFVYTLLKQSS